MTQSHRHRDGARQPETAGVTVTAGPGDWAPSGHAVSESRSSHSHTHGQASTHSTHGTVTPGPARASTFKFPRGPLHPPLAAAATQLQVKFKFKFTLRAASHWHHGTVTTLHLPLKSRAFVLARADRPLHQDLEPLHL